MSVEEFPCLEEVCNLKNEMSDWQKAFDFFTLWHPLSAISWTESSSLYNIPWELGT